MASTNKSSLGLNMWEASDKPERADFVADNRIIDEKIAKLNSDLATATGNIGSISPLIIKNSLNTMDGTVDNKRFTYGVYESTTSSGKPTNSGGMIFSVYNSATSGVQIAVTVEGSVFTRKRNSEGSTWAAWTQI